MLVVRSVFNMMLGVVLTVALVWVCELTLVLVLVSASALALVVVLAFVVTLSLVSACC